MFPKGSNYVSFQFLGEQDLTKEIKHRCFQKEATMFYFKFIDQLRYHCPKTIEVKK